MKVRHIILVSEIQGTYLQPSLITVLSVSPGTLCYCNIHTQYFYVLVTQYRKYCQWWINNVVYWYSTLTYPFHYKYIFCWHYNGEWTLKLMSSAGSHLSVINAYWSLPLWTDFWLILNMLTLGRLIGGFYMLCSTHLPVTYDPSEHSFITVPAQ